MVNDSEESTSIEDSFELMRELSSNQEESIDLGNARPHKCNRCQETFKNESSLQAHVRYLSIAGTSSLPVLPVTYLSKCRYEDDISANNAWMKAKENGMNVIELKDFLPARKPIPTLYHQEDSIYLNNARPLKCILCQGTFKHESSLQAHKCSPQDENQKFQCPTCNQTFNNLNRLNIHLRKHDKDRPYECSVCKNTFKVFGTLTRHERNKHDKYRTSCPICNRVIADSQSLNRHVRSHENLTTYECDRCKAVFKKKSNLDDHRRMHTGESRFSCKVCTKSFKTLRSLRQHVINHETGKLPYQCQTCKEAFRNPTSLKYHEYKHSGVTPYPCDLCDTSFRTPTQLRNHKKNHNVKRMSELTVSEDESGKMSKKDGEVARSIPLLEGGDVLPRRMDGGGHIILNVECDDYVEVEGNDINLMMVKSDELTIEVLCVDRDGDE